MEHQLTVESDTYAPIMTDTGKYEDCMPRFSGTNGYYCGCGARKDKLYGSASVMNNHMKTKTHQKWLEVLNLNRANHFVENIKLQETVASQRLIIARFEKTVVEKDATISYLTRQLTAQSSAVVTNLLD